ncbi:prolyl oligopeptidase family serine peptidase [Thalassoroseus pseudoceratinae]|uniref:prolyl oligopeptidase family serine peptidase n=1 Tax=Thalassoroseus pseudoceratinae TaxID=2713176 RepID=UPI001421D7F5|nr:alpha/beta hydrolase-fold protein [Thalassoroseus pseudoceratinae]
MKSSTAFPVCLAVWLGVASAPLWSQEITAEQEHSLRKHLTTLRTVLDAEKARRIEAAEKDGTRLDLRSVADVEVYAKAVEWALRWNEFPKKNYFGDASKALHTGLMRAERLKVDKPVWNGVKAKTIRGYYSKIDQSVQPYALTLPNDFDPESTKRWPLYVVLHGRANQMNEVNFIARHDGKPTPDGQSWIQLDVYGRGNNAYRWAGETDVFEAIEDVRRRYRIDHRRISLWGFSMGGAGAWHLGLHHPGKWASVGAGAGFVDFYKYQKQSEKLPPWQHSTLHIYDAVDYSMNAFNVPMIGYGGEKDPQRAAAESVAEAAKSVGIEIDLLVGKNMGHKFDEDSREKFMAFLAEKNATGRPGYPGQQELRFITYTPKYNRCDWLEVSQLGRMYEPAIVEGGRNSEGILSLKTKNVVALKIAREVAAQIEIDGQPLPLSFAADGLLPDVYYVHRGRGWRVLNYDESRNFDSNTDLMKRRDLQGPIDDAFMQPFVCVRGTGTPRNQAQNAWANWTFERFQREFDQWMRAEIPTVNDDELTPEMIQEKNIVLFGDPGSNSVLAKILPDLPVRWTDEKIQIADQTFNATTHGLCMIFPNPLNPNRYVVINSGHTFHEKDFKASNSWLFPRLGDVAVVKFEKTTDSYKEEIAWANIFNSGWRLPQVRNTDESEDNP